MAAAQVSDIPVGTQFSPALINLAAFVEVCIVYSGDRGALESAVWRPPVRIGSVEQKPSERRRRLPLEAAVQYGLLTPSEYEATDLAIKLVKLPPSEALEEFARHILLRRNGLRLVEMAERMDLEGLEITSDTLAAYCSDQGFNIIVHNTAINTMRMWLAKVGIFVGRSWQVDPVAKARILGLSDSEVAALLALTAEQRAFAVALCRINPEGEISASQVRDTAEMILGRRLPRGNSRLVLEPLKDAGYIEFTSGGTGGGKTATLHTLPAFQANVVEPFLTEAVEGLDSALVAYYKRPVAEIYADIESNDRLAQAQALEAYVIQIMRLLGLRFVRWRRRAQHTGGRADVGAVMTGLLGGVPSRWQIQCTIRAGGKVTDGEIAEEVGLLSATKATHILILTNVDFADDAKAFAHSVMSESAVSVFLLGREDFEKIRNSRGGALVSLIRGRSQVIASLERTGLDWFG